MAEPPVLAVARQPQGAAADPGALGTVLSPPGEPLVAAVPAGRCQQPVLAAAPAALDVDGGEVAPAQQPQRLAEGEGQTVALAGDTWRGGRRTKRVSVPVAPGV